MVELVLPRIAFSVKEAWFGCHLLLAPLLPWEPRMPKLSLSERVLIWDAFSPLFADSSSEHRHWAPMVEDVQWAVFRLTFDA